ncbi:MAG: 5-formyltetrahydrofolate cyclo-ligase [Nitritalea sp.]
MASEFSSKQQLRARYRELRRGLSADWRAVADVHLCAAVLDYVQKLGVQHVHVFLPIQRLQEVDTFPLVEKLLSAGFQVYTSRMVGEDVFTVPLLDLASLEEDAWGIPVPAVGEPVSEEVLELVLVPLLAYNARGYRIGYGKGVYDRLLKRCSSGVYAIGLSYFSQPECFEAEGHDVALTALCAVNTAGDQVVWHHF